MVYVNCNLPNCVFNACTWASSENLYGKLDVINGSTISWIYYIKLSTHCIELSSSCFFRYERLFIWIFLMQKLLFLNHLNASLGFDLRGVDRWIKNVFSSSHFTLTELQAGQQNHWSHWRKRWFCVHVGYQTSGPLNPIVFHHVRWCQTQKDADKVKSDRDGDRSGGLCH